MEIVHNKQEYDDIIDNIGDVINNQVVTYVNGLTIDNPVTNFNKTHHLSILEITDTLDKLVNICNLSNAIPSTLNDHLYNLKTFNRNRNVSYDGKNLLYRVKDEVLAGKLVSLSEEETSLLDAPLVTIFDKYNDLLVKNNGETFAETYTEIRNEKESLNNENINLREQLEALREELIMAQKENEAKNNQINVLTQEKENYEELKDKVLTIASTIK